MQLSDYWVIQYSPTQDVFHLDQLGAYLSETHRAFYEGKSYDWILLAVHPNQDAAVGELEVWQARRDKHPVGEADRAARMLYALAMHFGQFAQAKIGLSDPSPPKLHPPRTAT